MSAAPPITSPDPPAATGRLVALDLFRGVTIAGMILVNNPGSWAPGQRYSPLDHAVWNGLTPTDLVFPFFLFIVGVALPFSFDKRLAQGASRWRLFEHVGRRSLILFFLGLILAGFPRVGDILHPALPAGAAEPPLARSLAALWPAMAPLPLQFQPWRLIFPYVLEILGLSLLFTDDPPLGWPHGAGRRLRKICAALLLLAGVAYFAADWDYFQQSRLRVPGVLQRIAACYFCAATFVLLTSFRRRGLSLAARFGAVVVILLAYWAIVRPGSLGLAPIAAAPADYRMKDQEQRPEGVLHDWLDTQVLGGHLYGERPDPEGILSTLPAIATVLLGTFAGQWLRAARGARDKAGWLFLAANVALVAGLWLALAFPLNKKIWSSSYVVSDRRVGAAFPGGVLLAGRCAGLSALGHAVPRVGDQCDCGVFRLEYRRADDRVLAGDRRGWKSGGPENGHL